MKDTFIMRKENMVSIERMSDADAGALFKAILAHANGVEIDLDESPLAVQLLFPLIAAQIDRADKAYQETCERRAEAGRAGGLAKASNAKQSQANDSKAKHSEPEPEYEPDIEPEDEKRKAPTEPKEKRTRFVPPTADQVSEYAQEKGLRLDAQRFVDFYASKGWKVGSSPMKDWRAAARNWASRDKKESPPNTAPPPANPFFEQERRIKADQDMFRTNYAELEKIDYSKLLRTGGG